MINRVDVVTSRLPQLVLITSTIAFSWLGMQVVHELGHVLAALAAGETVQRVILHPLTISRTDVSHDRHPQMVVWGGPIVGTVLPVVLMGGARAIRSNFFYLFQFFAGFCLLANGVYLGIGSIGGEGDAGDLLRFGSPRWPLIAFGLATAPAGLWLWNGLGPHFGLGTPKGEVDRRAVGWALGACLAIVVVEMAVGTGVDPVGGPRR